MTVLYQNKTLNTSFNMLDISKNMFMEKAIQKLSILYQEFNLKKNKITF